MSKLRLDYFLSLGLKLVEGDEVWHCRALKLDSSTQAESYNSARDYDCSVHITSFAPRKNEGVQPCGDDAPVVVNFNDYSASSCGSSANGLEWKICHACSDIYSWKPDLDALIKMQAENDAKQVKQTKTRAKVEYVKCEKSSIFNLCEMFELKELHFDANCDESKKLPVETERHLTQLFFSDSPIYRKVEAEITWQDEVNSCIYDIRSSDGTRLLKYQITAIKEAIKENPYAVLSLCHLVASMTDKPE
jgi:uncharacterized protein YqkB